MTIGDNIKKIRKEKKMTQQDLAKKIGISRSYLGDVENNRKNLSSKTLKNLSEKLNISMLYLTTGNKALSDLNENEQNEQNEKIVLNEKSRFNNIQGELKKDLTELSTVELGFLETQLLSHAIWFLKKSDEQELTNLLVLLSRINENQGEPLNISQSEIRKRIEEETNYFKEFLEYRYGYEGD